MKYTKNPLKKQEDQINMLLFKPVLYKNNKDFDFFKIKIELPILYKKLKEKNKNLSA